MKRLQTTGLLLFVAVAAAYAASALTVDQVLKDSKKHDGKVVTVTGEVSNFQEKTSRAGNPYTTLDIKGENSIMKAYTQGHLKDAPKNKDIVEVTGVYRAEKKVSDTFTVKNEIDFTIPKNDRKNEKKIGLKITKKATNK